MYSIVKKEEVPSHKTIRGVAGLIIGLEMVSLVMIGSTESNGPYYAIAKDQPPSDMVTSTSSSTTSTSNVQKIVKWSDRIRMCPQWHLNALESIVPENLPRPSARRRLEFAGHAPATKFSTIEHVNIRGSADCFSM